MSDPNGTNESQPDPGSSSSRPRARLGPTEIVTFNPDSDDDENDDGFVEVDGANDAEEDADILGEYDDDTEVCALHGLRRSLRPRTSTCSIYA